MIRVCFLNFLRRVSLEASEIVVIDFNIERNRLKKVRDVFFFAFVAIYVHSLYGIAKLPDFRKNVRVGIRLQKCN